MTSHHTMSSIPKYIRYHHKAYILSLKQQNEKKNKKTLIDVARYKSLIEQNYSTPSDILIGQTRSANSSHGLPKYLMIHSPFCSMNVTYLLC